MKYVVPSDLYYTKEHEWAAVVNESGEGKLVKVGVTDYAQSKLGDVVYAVLPSRKSYKKGDVLAELEAYKGVSEVYAPVSGEVVEVNGSLGSSPELVNQDPYGKGWIALIRPTDLEGEISSLLRAKDYEAFILGLKRRITDKKSVRTVIRGRRPRYAANDRC